MLNIDIMISYLPIGNKFKSAREAVRWRRVATQQPTEAPIWAVLDADDCALDSYAPK
jgi:hypothetical protein